MLLRALVLLVCASPALAQLVSPPEYLGAIAGPGATVDPPGVRFYGTDLGWTFEHRGTHYMLFGDTWPHDKSMCDPLPHNDDSHATFPLTLPDAGLPKLTVTTDPDDPDEFARLRLFTDGTSQVMGYNKTPLTGFSDGENAVVLFGLIELVRCGTRKGKPTCRPYEHLACSQDVGICVPEILGYDAVCDIATNTGCIATLGQQCQPTTTGLCVDPTSSQYDGTTASLPSTAAYHSHIGFQDDPARPADFVDAGVISSNKFIALTAKTVRCFSGKTCGSDYATGHGAVLIWGRPGYERFPTGQSHMYLMAHRLPLRRDRRGRVRWRPRYFAGVRPGTNEPIWTKRESRAQPLSMDGTPGGNPDDDHGFPNHHTVSWLGPPVNKWMMIYGGGGSDVSGGFSNDAAGAVLVRFADQPWGPWSPPVVHLDPGNPSTLGAPFGPGGFMFHPACTDQPPAMCAPSDPHRPLDYFVPGCPEVGKTLDTAILYGVDIIDAYTRSDGGNGLDVFWLASPWNPYFVGMLRTNVQAGASTPTDCAASRRSGPRLRWCAE